MSRSSDRGPPGQAGDLDQIYDDLFGDPTTTPQTRDAAAPPLRLDPPSRSGPDVGAELPPIKDKPGQSPIVPAGSVTGRSLTLVVIIMCFLASLTAGAVYMMNQSAKAWLKDIASEVTVQLQPTADAAETERLVQSVAAFLKNETGITSVAPYSLKESAKLLEPWLGQGEVRTSLPIPRLIAIELSRSSPPDMAALQGRLQSRFKTASLDDHRHWQRQIRTVTRSFALGGIAILLLVGAATTAIIISATRSAMASNHEIVEVLHLVGATDRFIAHEFEKHFLRLGIRAGLVGALLAMAVFLAMP